MTTNWTHAAKALKAFLERKLRLSLDFLADADDASSTTGPEALHFASELSQYGLYGVRSSKALTEDQRLEIQGTFESVLGDIVRMSKKAEDLSRREQMIELSERHNPSNVIPLRRSRLLSITSGASRAPSRSGWVLKQDCLIEAVSVSEILKMALELHSLASRCAFIEFANLNPEIRRNPQALAQLGEINLFIPNLVEVPLDEQRALTDLIAMNTLERPLLMAGTVVPYSDLRSEPRVHLDLLLLLSRVYIKLTRPFQEYKEQGLIHYFLDSLSENPT